MARKKPKKRKSLFRRIIGGIFLTIFTLILVGGLCVCAYVAKTLSAAEPINPKEIYSKIEQNSYIYDSDGNLIDTLHFNEDRKIIEIKDMPADLKNAFVAIEDKTFWTHKGFNFRRMVGAVLSSITGKTQISGTSTITQQLARNVFLSEEKSQRTIKRKLTEMYYAWQIEQVLSKDEILEAYLNTIYLGYGTYGVDSAAKTYFGKSVQELTLPECAALAALPQAPDGYAFLKDEEGEATTKIKGTGLYANDISKDRRNLVLKLMVEQGYITQEEADEANVDIIDILNPTFEEKDTVYSYVNDYVTESVIKGFMDEYGLTESRAAQKVYTGGLHIYTTINPTVQQIVYDEFQNDGNFPYAYDGSEVQAAMVITEVGSGKIIAMVGGRNTSGSMLFNRATSPRQPGSSLKPIAVYGAALQKSFEFAQRDEKFHFVETGYDSQGTKKWGDYITTNSFVKDEKMKVNGNEWPKNVTRTYSGNQTFRTAIQQSINTCAVKILAQVGIDYSADMVERFGITTLQREGAVNDMNLAALGLGAMAHGTTPLEMAMAYAVFPNGGKLNTPVCYTKVMDSEGKMLLSSDTKEYKVLDPGVAWIMTDVLKSVVSRGIGYPAAISGVQVGGKTGTTDDKYDIWFNGFTPKYSAALWIGTDKNREMSSRSEAAARLWSRIMSQVPDIREGTYRDMPSNVVQTGGEYFTEGTNTGLYYESKKSKRTDVDDLFEDIDDSSSSKSSSSSSKKEKSSSSRGSGGSVDSAVSDLFE